MGLYYYLLNMSIFLPCMLIETTNESKGKTMTEKEHGPKQNMSAEISFLI